MMNDLIKKALSLGVGITVVSKERIEKYVDDLVKRGEVGQSESKELVAKLVQRGEEEQAELKRFVREQLQQVLKELHLATSDDVARLEARIAALESSRSEAAPEGQVT